MSLDSEDIERLTAILEDNRSPGRKHQEKALKANEAFCDICNKRITLTKSMGEVGHRAGENPCPMRKLEYKPERESPENVDMPEYQDKLRV